MPDTGVFCSQADMLMHAGVGVATALTAAVDTTFTYSNKFIRQAETLICVQTKKNWYDIYASTLNADVKYILELATAVQAATFAVKYDPSGYGSSTAATLQLNVLDNIFKQCMKELAMDDVQKWMVAVA